jgi:hypothetical protein
MTLTHDFPDWLSPMLVKELRQGMRSKVLLISLFLLQSLLILNAIVGLGAAADGNLSGTTGVFWSILALPLLLILPLSALGGIANEIKANTLDLVFLTRLTARRIVLGKWIAVVVQSVLLTLTVLPYIALRYYLGGINITSDLFTAGLILLGSAMLSALTVALSSYPSQVVRIFIGLGFIFSLQMITPLLLVGAGHFGMIGIWSDGVLATVLLVLAPIFLLLMIEVGAIRIAPPAENHAGMVRLLVLLVVLVIGAASMVSARSAWLIIVAQVFAVPFCVAALCECPPTVPGVFRALVRRGWIGSLLSRIFTPGWHTGFLFVVLVWALIAFFWQQAGWLTSHQGDEHAALRSQLSLAGFGVSLLLPAIIAPSLSRKRFLYFLGFFLISFAMFAVVSALAQTSSSKDAWIQMTAFLPPLAIFGPAYNAIDPSDQLMALGSLALLLFAICAVKSRAAWSQSDRLRKLARQKPLHVA